MREWGFQIEIKLRNTNISVANYIAKAVEEFRDYVLTWYIQNNGTANTLNWDTFITLLTITFEPAGKTALLCQQLEQLNCKEKTLIKYITELHRLTSKIYNTEKAKIFKFIYGLDYSTANEVA